MFKNLLLALLICTTLIYLYKHTSFKGTGGLSKSAPFECGFEPSMTMRRPFSVRFFILVLLFLIFDVETVLLFPVVMKMTVMPYNLIMLESFFLFYSF